MMSPSPSAHIWVAAGHTDMRRGIHGLSALVQTALSQNPFSGHLHAFRVRRGDLIKILWFYGDRLCLSLRKLERGRFVWPQAEKGAVSLTCAQAPMLLERIGSFSQGRKPWLWKSERRSVRSSHTAAADLAQRARRPETVSGTLRRCWRMDYGRRRHSMRPITLRKPWVRMARRRRLGGTE